MGGAVAIYAAANLPPVNCVIAENTFYSCSRVVGNWSWWRLRVPYWPIVPLTLFFVKMKIKAEPETNSPWRHVKKVKKPLLFINADNDDLVPLKDGKKLFAMCPSEKKSMWVVSAASHAKCAETAGEKYKQTVFKFFDDNFRREKNQEKLPKNF